MNKNIKREGYKKGLHMLLRDRLVLEYLAHGKNMSEIAGALEVNRAIVGKIVARLEKRGHLIVDRSKHPVQCRVTENGLHPLRGYETREVGGVTSQKMWGLRAYGLKFSFSGPAPETWKSFKAGWRGGKAYLLYARMCRLEAYVGSKGAKTLVVYAPPDMEADNPRTLEAEANAYCIRTAELLAGKIGWNLSSQRDITGAVIPIKKGEYDARPLKFYAEKLRELKLTPIYTEHGKIDQSPKPAATQVYGREWAEKVLEGPAITDMLQKDYVRHVSMFTEQIREHLTAIKELRDATQGQRVATQEQVNVLKELKDEIKKGLNK